MRQVLRGQTMAAPEPDRLPTEERHRVEHPVLRISLPLRPPTALEGCISWAEGDVFPRLVVLAWGCRKGFLPIRCPARQLLGGDMAWPLLRIADPDRHGMARHQNDREPEVQTILVFGADTARAGGNCFPPWA